MYALVGRSFKHGACPCVAQRRPTHCQRLPAAAAVARTAGLRSRSCNDHVIRRTPWQSGSKSSGSGTLQRCHASSGEGSGSGSDASSSETWPWKSPNWRELQQQGAAAGQLEAERSSLVNEEIVYFIFQLELDAQLQRALNYEAYEAAQQIRVKRETVDMALRDMQERKAASAASSMSEEDAVGAGAAQASLDLSDSMSEGLRLRSEMQRAVQEERYTDAAKFRDMLATLDRQAKQAAALAAEAAVSDPSKVLQLRLGQRVVHRQAGYRGVVVGWDLGCCEGEEWQAAAQADKLTAGLSQPFYHLLVEVSDWRYDAAQPPVAYVAQELLSAPELEDEGASWSQVYGSEPLQHPYSYVLFLGQGARGDMLPCRQLRDKYSARRRDVYRPGQEPSEDDADDEEKDHDDDGGSSSSSSSSGGGGGGGQPDGGSSGGGGGMKIPGIDMSSLDD